MSVVRTILVEGIKSFPYGELLRYTIFLVRGVLISYLLTMDYFLCLLVILSFIFLAFLRIVKKRKKKTLF